VSFPPPLIEHCVRHPQVITGRHCTRCGRPACNDCLVQVEIGSQCLDCIRAARPAARERARYWNASQNLLVTRVLIAINVMVFVWTVTGAISNYGGTGINSHQFDIVLARPFIENGEWYRMITAGFLHFGLLHIGMNMFILWQLGNMLEPALGRARFVAIYFASLIGGSIGALILSPDSFTGGASGAVFGLMAAAAVILHRRGVDVMRTGIGTTLILNLVITFAVPGISIGGHLGGAMVGAILALTIR
jgi:membrane associated rhomboid family serine protease